MFVATLLQRQIPDTEKISHLKTLLTGKAKLAVSGKGYSGKFYGCMEHSGEQIWETSCDH